MKLARLSAVVAVILLAIAAVSQSTVTPAPTTETKPYTSPDGKFTVQFPKAPKVETDHFKVKGVDVTETSYSVLDEEHKGIWIVVQRVYPTKIDEQKEVDAHWAEFQDGTKVLSGPFDSTKMVGHPATGGVVAVPISEGRYILTMVIITAADDSVYMVDYACDYDHAKDVPPTTPVSFIKSFKINTKQGAQPQK